MSAPPVIVGTPKRSAFGLQSDELVRRQWAGRPSDGVLVVAADWAILSPTLNWLAQHPGRVLTAADGAAIAGVVPQAQVEALVSAIEQAASPAPPFVPVGAGNTLFVKGLRRRERMEAINLRATAIGDYERVLFDKVYKGVTDAVTKYLWPLPAFHVVRLLARTGVRPNAVTMVGIALTFAAAWWFAAGAFGLALVAAWWMTFLDTVDGKLARVTHTSSRIGDLLDHGTDWVHPPVWWTCLGIGLIETGLFSTASTVAAGTVIVGGYFFGRASEGVFKLAFGFNQYIWRPLDATLRLVIARRNPNLVILTAAYVAGHMADGFLAVAGWTVITIGLQLVRLGMALAVRKVGGQVASYLEDG